MPLQIIRQDITRMEVDAIVNPSNRHLEPGGGTDLAIHKAAGAELTEYCKSLGGCPVGKAKITPGFKLPCKYVIHTAGPNWYSVINPKKLLVSCYKECLKLAVENNCDSVAFPLISAGLYGYPKDKVLKIAIEVISDFLFEHEMLIYLVVYDKKSYEFSEKLFSDIKSYIDDNYVLEHEDNLDDLFGAFPKNQRSIVLEERRCFSVSEPLDFSEALKPLAPQANESLSLSEMLKEIDDSFAVTLMKLIDLKGMTDVECYKKSNVSKKTFWKILNQKDYRPSKNTVLSFAIGLELTLDETLNLLRTVGFTLSHSSKFDIVVEYFIKNGNYNIFEINEALFEFDLPCLGV